MQRAAGLILICAVTVAVVDVAFQSSLLHLVRPAIISPADGAFAAAPVTVRWEGPQPLVATLVGSGLRTELGPRESPFEIEASRFPRPGRYRIELRAPRLGRFISAERRFRIEAPPASAAASDQAPPPIAKETGAPPPPGDRDGLRLELDRAQADKIELEEYNASLQSQNRELTGALDALRAEQQQTDSQLAESESQHADLVEQHLLALQENQLLRARLAGIPLCTAWGYLSYPRPQGAVPRRVVLVSNGRGQIFRSEAECVATRRADPSGASPCICVGPVWDGAGIP